MTTLEICLLVCVAIGFLWTGFELGMMEAQRRTKIIIPASLADIMIGKHLWKPASNPPGNDRVVFAYDRPPKYCIARYRMGYWYNEDGKIFFPDYWMDIPNLPKEDAKLF